MACARRAIPSFRSLPDCGSQRAADEVVRHRHAGAWELNAARAQIAQDESRVNRGVGPKDLRVERHGPAKGTRESPRDLETALCRIEDETHTSGERRSGDDTDQQGSNARSVQRQERSNK
jgi:hypothetical protein